MKDTLVVKKATPLGARVWTSLLVFGFIGQIAWMVENVYFSTYIQKNITAAGWATSATVAASATAAALATIFSAAWSDRVGKRRAFVCWGYILWGITTAAFELFGNGQVGGSVGLAVTLFVVMDCVMSAIGSTANDSAFSAWVTDVTDVTNRGVVDIVLSILPIVAVCVLFQLLTHHYRRRQLLRTGVGFLYTIIGLILFLTGVNIGFTPVGNLLGSGLADSTYRWVLIPIGALIGYYIVKAEPAVQVLNKQVEDVTGGTVSQSMMNTALSIGVACAVMLSMVRVLTGISIYWILVPGYALALILARYVPSVFVGIAFASGGVASGPMTSTFLLPLAMGACTALGGNVVTDAFGVVALVALAPPVAIQIMGVIYVHRAKAVAEDKADLLPDDGVIDLEDEEI